MPAYFSIVFELKKSKTVMKKFYTALVNSGLNFQSGYCEFENNSFDEIITWNQNKLDNDFVLENEKEFSYDYQQTLFNFSDFREVRLFVITRDKSSTVEFNLIFPELEFFDAVTNENGGYTIIRKTEKMDLLKSLAKSMWERLEILAVQTCWELSDCPPEEKDISIKVKPHIEPFCIIRKLNVAKKLGLPFENLSNGGIFIEAEDGWYFL